MSDQLDQKAALHELAVARAAERTAKYARVIALHAERLPREVIARRLGMCGTTVKKVLQEAGLTPWRPCDVDATGVAV